MKKRAAFILAISLFFSLCCGCTSGAPPASPTAGKEASARQMIRDYYAAYEKKDWSLMAPILADGFTFTSPAGDDHIDLKTYKERCWPNALKTKRFDLEKVMIDGDDAFVTYNGWTNDGTLFRNTEHFTFKDGKITANECFFGPGVSYPNNAGKK
jgi:ketosteroid isomerase-like protein